VIYPHPKPPKKSKRGPTVIRVKGKAMEKLRRDCFERDFYRCRGEIPGFFDPCGKLVTWETGHMAHIISRGRRGPDVISNVVTKCAECHIGIEHSYGPSGVKPCPPKGTDDVIQS